ncbi:MAG: hypothetical protein LAO23_01350 [Acidobacteriia bacterium]|nr:hypothetical protein [Terriglobia bacterium]
MNKMVSVLVDLSVRRYGIFAEDVQIEKKINWGGHEHTSLIAGWKRKPDRSATEGWLQKQILYLPTIARLTKEGTVECYSYIELTFEEARGTGGMRGTFGDLFAGVNVKNCLSAVNRSRFRQNVDFSEYLRKEGLPEFCDFLLKLDPSLLRQAREFYNMLPVFEQESLMQLERFKSLCRHLSERHYSDAFHLWTAQANGPDYFLTLDKKFVNAVSSIRDYNFRSKPILPEQLLNVLGVTKIDPHPFPGSDPRYFE